MMMHSGISPIVENLWIGGFPDAATVQYFDKLILCAAEHQPDSSLFPGVHVLHAPLSPTLATLEEVRSAVQAGRAVATWIRNGKKVLVSDALGLNRSALIAASALMTRSIPADQAIEMIRSARGAHALLNPNFVDLLGRLGETRAFHVIASP